ncbi:MAG TPA: SDR family NAD(P)-dependent oxidoreductase [Vicinamibacterales bacterium]|nr:SDR family NAD(P)-dependent oxidoreductase [Vicinamibacterales bacterium]
MTAGNWRGRTVLVTGAGGFIGSHLVEALVSKGAATRALVRYTSNGSRGWLDRSPAAADVEFIASDICDERAVAKATAGVDTVFHLAALIGIPYSYDAPDSYVRTNVEGTANVLRCAINAGVRRVVHTSTSEVYGTAKTVPIREDHPLQTQSPYSATKAGADLLAWSYHRSFGLSVATVRPFNTYGPRQSARAVIPTIVTQALTGEEIRLGHLTPTRDFTFVADTVEGFLRIANADRAVGAVVNLGSGRETSIGDLAKRIVALTESHAKVMVDARRERPATSEVDRLCADASFARELGWSPQHDLDTGLRLTIDWVKANLAAFRTGEYSI